MPRPCSAAPSEFSHTKRAGSSAGILHEDYDHRDREELQQVPTPAVDAAGEDPDFWMIDERAEVPIKSSTINSKAKSIWAMLWVTVANAASHTNRKRIPLRLQPRDTVRKR